MALADQLLCSDLPQPLLLAEFNHSSLAAPLRLVRDNADVVSGGNTFKAVWFTFQRAPSKPGEVAKVSVVLARLNEALAAWFNASAGGRGGTVTFRQIARAAPDAVLETLGPLDVLDVVMTMTQINVVFRGPNLDQPAVLQRHSPTNSPGLYA